jgi:hypothetical protein
MIKSWGVFCNFLLVMSVVRLSLNCCHQWVCCLCMESHGGITLTGENWRSPGNPCFIATFSTINPTWTDSSAYPGLRVERPTTNRLSHGTAVLKLKPSRHICIILVPFNVLSLSLILSIESTFFLLRPRIEAEEGVLHTLSVVDYWRRILGLLLLIVKLHIILYDSYSRSIAYLRSVKLLNGIMPRTKFCWSCDCYNVNCLQCTLISCASRCL